MLVNFLIETKINISLNNVLRIPTRSVSQKHECKLESNPNEYILYNLVLAQRWLIRKYKYTCTIINP